MKTWYTKNGERIVDVTLTQGKEPSYGDGWLEAPDEWGGSPGDALKWFGDDMRRIPDSELVMRGIRKDRRNKKFYKKDNHGETKKYASLTRRRARSTPTGNHWQATTRPCRNGTNAKKHGSSTEPNRNSRRRKRNSAKSGRKFRRSKRDASDRARKFSPASTRRKIGSGFVDIATRWPGYVRGKQIWKAKSKKRKPHKPRAADSCICRPWSILACPETVSSASIL